MSCNCKGKIPNSVTLRLQCAFVAAQASSVIDVTDAAQRNGFVQLAKSIYDHAIAVDVSSAELDAGCEDDGLSPKIAARAERNATLAMPIAALRTMRGSYLDLIQKLCKVTTVGELVQSPDAIAGHEKDVKAINAALKPYGLYLGMETDELRKWIEHGKQDDQTAQG